MTPASMARRPARKGAPDDVARRSPSHAAIAAAAPRKSPFTAMGLSLNGIVQATLLVARVPLYAYERSKLYLRWRHERSLRKEAGGERTHTEPPRRIRARPGRRLDAGHHTSPP